jgi:Protein of unknown function (DUF2865)
MALVAAIALAVVVPVAPASAQGVFNTLLGSPQRPVTTPAVTFYANTTSQISPFVSNPFSTPFGATPTEPVAAPRPSVAYCVRLCDGRFFPIQRSTGADPVEACNSFCPAARTKVFSGSAIEQAVARDGSSYGKLETAFVYRDRIVPGCTCNGRNAFGLVIPNTTDDPTLRSGDIVASERGFVAYAGGGRQNAEFTPIKAGSSAELRQKLAGAKIVPRNTTPVPTAEQFAAMRAGSDDGSPADRKRSRRLTAQR